MESDDVIEQLSTLLASKNQHSFQIADVNFKIGKLLAESVDLLELMKSLAQSGSNVREPFLHDCIRVYRTLGSESMLWKLRSKFKGALSWWFLVNNCTKAPVGDSPEAIAYWEEKMGLIEKAFSGLETMAETFDQLPTSVRQQLAGLLSGVGSCIQSRQPRQVLEGPLRIAHLADLHMSETLQSGGKIVIDPETGLNERLVDMHTCLSFAVDRIIADGCRLALITEPTETHQPTPNEQRYLLASILRLAESGIPVIVEPGNHGISKNPNDSSALAFLQGRRNVHVVERPTVLYLEGNTVLEQPSETWPQTDCAKIFVLPFPARSIMNGKIEGLSIEETNRAVSGALRTILTDFRAQIDDRVPNILLSHLTVIGATGAENPEMSKYDPHLYPEDFEGFDYVALGHIHIHQQVAPNAWYAGSIDRNDFNEEGQKKGFITTTFEGGAAHVDFIETPSRDFQTVSPDFFLDDGWESQIVPRTIYRIKGEISKEQREALRPFINRFMEIAPLQYKLTAERTVRVRDAQMTEEMSETDAMKRFMAARNYDNAFINACLEMFNSVISGDKQEGGVENEAFTLTAG